jgi:hypothetical protein
LLDLAADRGIELTEERAARAARAGRGAALRERLLAGDALVGEHHEAKETDGQLAGSDRPG